MNGGPIHPGKNAKPLVIKRHLDILSSSVKGNKKSSYKKYVIKGIFSVKSESKVCKRKEDRHKQLMNKLDKTDLLKLVGDLFNSYKDLEAKANDKKQDIVMKFPLGRKLLSLDEEYCDSDNCSNNPTNEEEINVDTNSVTEEETDESGNDSEVVSEGNGGDIEDEHDNTEEDYEDYDDGDEDFYEELLSEEELDNLMKGKDVAEKIEILNNLLDELEEILTEDDIDNDLYTAAIQTLILYTITVEDLGEETKPEDLTVLRTRVNGFKAKYLSQIMHFEIFAEKAWKNFTELNDMESLDTKNRESISLLNNFIFNFHYASEIENIIKRRNIEEEISIVESFSENMKVMREAFESLGYGDETQDANYFSRMLENFDDEDEVYQKRKLLSISDEVFCHSGDDDCSDVEKCKNILEKSKQLTKANSFDVDYFQELSNDEKYEYIEAYTRELNASMNLAQEIGNLLKNIGNDQDYITCQRMLNGVVVKLRLKSQDTKWWKFAKSFFLKRAHSKQMAEVMQSVNKVEPQNEFTSVRKRKLLSVEENDYCEKDDIECRKRSESDLFKRDKKVKKQRRNKDKRLENLSEELEDAYLKTKDGHKNKKETQRSGLSRCQEFLETSQQDLDQVKKLEPQIKTMGNMQPKQKIKIIKKFMSFMTKAKKMFDEYKEISSSLTDDAIICKPILKE